MPCDAKKFTFAPQIFGVEDYSLVVGFQELSDVKDLFYPEVFVASKQKNVPAYFEKLGLPEVLTSYGFDTKDQMISQLIRHCSDAHPDFLVGQYSPNKKKPSPFSSLMEDKVIGSSIRKRIDFNINKVLELCLKHQIPIYKHIERKIYLPEIEIRNQRVKLKPSLKFEKTATGINYTLYLLCGTKVLVPSNINCCLFTHQPNRILMGYDLFEVEEIEALKLKPFLAKEVIFIPDRIAYQYFSNFVSDLLNKVDVEINGIEYEDLEVPMTAMLSFGDAWLSEDFEAMLHFYYGEMKFSSADKARAKTKIEVSPDNKISVFRIKRDLEAELKLLEQLKSLGIEMLANGRYGFENRGKFAFLHHIIDQKEALLNANIRIKSPEFGGKKVNLSRYSIHLVANEQPDWFDVSAEIRIGDFDLPFKDLISQIKKGEPSFVLPDGTVFIIPAEWMEKYEMMARFIEDKGEEMRLAKSNFSILDKLQLLAETSSLKVYESGEVRSDISISNLMKAELRPYQMEGARWLISHHENGLGACLADDMGLGKTVQTLAVLLHAKDKIKSTTASINTPRQLSLFETYTEQRSALCALIVLPASLVFNWENEIKKFAPSLMVSRHLGPERAKSSEGLKHYDIILTTYQTMVRDFELLSKINFSYIVLDESHYIKNKDSQVFQKITLLNTNHRVSLSGTPIENSLSDLWSQMQFINPEILGAYPFFKKHFQDPIEKLKDQQAIEELRGLVKPFILRRTKEQVLDDLPELEEQIFYSEMSPEQFKWSEKEKSKARNELLFGSEEGEEVNKIRIINALMRLRQLANHPLLLDEHTPIASGKYVDVTNTLDSIVAARHKTIVFSSFVKHLEIYEQYLQEEGVGYAKLTGENSQKEREQAVQKFSEEEDCMVFLMSIKAGGVGLNLTNAHYVLILDPWWNPFAERQAIGRAHRIGQKNKVSVLRFIAKDSIEEKILKLQQTKIKLAGEFIDVGEAPELTRTDLAEILS